MPPFLKNISTGLDQMFILYDEQHVCEAIEDTIWTNFDQFFVDGLLESENEEICKIDGHSHSGAVSLREGISFGDIVIFVSFRFA